MDDLKSVTLDYLRGLARKHLGPGHSKLTKRELIAALAQFVPALKKLAQPAAKAASPAAKPSREPRSKETRAVDKKKQPEKKVAGRKPEPEKKAPEKKAPVKKAPERKAAERKPEPKKKAPEKKAAERKPEPEKKAPEKKAASPRPAPPKAEELSQSSKPAQVVNFPPRPRFPRSAEEAWQEETAEMVVESPELEKVFQHAAEPLVEGFFVARMMGEREVRRHHLTEDREPRFMVHGGEQSRGLEENLGELPLDYGDDLALALARDPYTLFVTWDFSPGTLARAREGLDNPRATLRVFDGDRLVREEEVALESRSFYIHGLPPGRPYRVEAHLVSRDGRSRRIGHSTHPLSLPRTGPSPDTSVYFMRMPPPPRVPAQAIPSPGVAGAGLSREEPLSEEHVEYAEERQYIQWRRVPLPGSDEMVESSESRLLRAARRARREGQRPEYLEISARPPGSSEQSAGRGGPARGGASEQTHWTPPPSGRGR